MLSLKGTYVLVLAASSKALLQIGRLGRLQVNPGFYVYIGSAFGPGGLKARVSHHKKISIRPYWHIDYLRTVTRIEEIWYTYDSVCREHQWAEAFMHCRDASVPVLGFGSSDCRCKSHLYFFQNLPSGNSFNRSVQSKFHGHKAVYIEKIVRGMCGSG